MNKNYLVLKFNFFSTIRSGNQYISQSAIHKAMSVHQIDDVTNSEEVIQEVDCHSKRSMLWTEGVAHHKDILFSLTKVFVSTEGI